MNRILLFFRFVFLSLFFCVSVFLFGFFAGKNGFSIEALLHKNNIHTVAAAGDYAGTQNLLDQGASANSLDAYLQTPLLHAAWWGHKEVVALLIARGVDVDAQSFEGFTGLYWAVNHGHYDIAEMLLKAGAKTNVYSVNEWTPLHEAAVHADDAMYCLLLAYGADEEATDRWGKTPRDLREARKN